MKSTQLLSVVLSLIMVFGVSAGSAFAQDSNGDFDDSSITDDSFDSDTYEDGYDDE